MTLFLIGLGVIFFAAMLALVFLGGKEAIKYYLLAIWKGLRK